MIYLVKRNEEGRPVSVPLHRGQSGCDEISSCCCPRCYSEAGDYGCYTHYKWVDAPIAGWETLESCGTCVYYKEGFVPYVE
jgi:hypothetical protein